MLDDNYACSRTPLSALLSCLHCVSKKFTCCCKLSRTVKLMIVVRNVTAKVSNQKMLYFPTSPT